MYSSALPPKDVILSLLWNSWQAAVGCALGLHENTYKYMGVGFAFHLLLACCYKFVFISQKTGLQFFVCAHPHFLSDTLAGNLEASSEDIRSLLIKLPDLCKPFLCIETIIREVYLPSAHQKHLEFTVLSILNIKVPKKSWKSGKMKTGEIQGEFKT